MNQLSQLTEKQRTAALGVAASLLVVVFLARTFRGNPADDVAPASRPDRGGVSAVSTAVAAHDRAALAALYKPIVDVDPFHSHPFVKKHDKPADKGGGGNVGPVDSGTTASSPNGLVLRLTGIVTASDGSAALLEDRSNGKGMFLRRGDVIGDRTVADVRTDSLVLAPKDGAQKLVEFGDKVELKPDDVLGRLVSLGPVTSSTSTGGSASGASSNLPALSDTEKDSVLQRLREKRKKSLGN